MCITTGASGTSAIDHILESGITEVESSRLGHYDILQMPLL